MRLRHSLLLGTMVLLGGQEVSCARLEDGADLKPPPGFVPPPVGLEVKGQFRAGRLAYGQGFYEVEVGKNGTTWRWMGAHGEVRLPNDGNKRTLRIRGWIPTEFMTGPPTIRLTLNGNSLGGFVPSDRSLTREYRVSAELLGSAPAVALVIETSITVHAPPDTRALGVAVEGIDWEPTR